MTISLASETIDVAVPSSSGVRIEGRVARFDRDAQQTKTGTQALSLFIVNRSVVDRNKAGKQVDRDAAMPFQVQLEIKSAAEILARPNRRDELPDHTDARALDLQFRDKREYVGHNVAAEPSQAGTRGARSEAVSAANVEKLLRVCRDNRYRVAILLAATTGLRIGEIRGLQWGDINELHRQLVVERSFDIRNNLTTTKSNRVRVVPIPDRLAVALETSDRLGPWVVARLDGDRLGYYAARDALVDLYDNAKITRPAQPWHCLRHTYCTQLANTGAAPHLIQSRAGHQSFSTTLRYIDPTSDEKRAAVAKAFGQHMANNRSKPTKKNPETLTISVV